MVIAPSHEFGGFKFRDLKIWTVRSFWSRMISIAQSICGLSARKTQLLPEFKIYTRNEINCGNRTLSLVAFNLEKRKNLTVLYAQTFTILLCYCRTYLTLLQGVHLRMHQITCTIELGSHGSSCRNCSHTWWKSPTLQHS